MGCPLSVSCQPWIPTTVSCAASGSTAAAQIRSFETVTRIDPQILLDYNHLVNVHLRDGEGDHAIAYLVLERLPRGGYKHTLGAAGEPNANRDIVYGNDVCGRRSAERVPKAEFTGDVVHEVDHVPAALTKRPYLHCKRPIHFERKLAAVCPTDRLAQQFAKRWVAVFAVGPGDVTHEVDRPALTVAVGQDGGPVRFDAGGDIGTETERPDTGYNFGGRQHQACGDFGAWTGVDLDLLAMAVGDDFARIETFADEVLARLDDTGVIIERVDVVCPEYFLN